jgi:hypothetical protein
MLSRVLLLVFLAALLALPAGCRRSAQAPGDPVAAVKGLARAIRDDDLLRYSQLSMPPELRKRMQERWHLRLQQAPPPTEAQRKDYARWMERLTAPDAEAKLFARYDARMKKFEKELNSQWPLMQATGTIFLNGLIKANDKLSEPEKAHARAVGGALLKWLKPELLTDRERAKQAIAVMTATARAVELPTLADTRKLEMDESLDKGSELLKAGKRIGRIYGLDLDASLAGVDARVLSAQGDEATMEVSYPLLGQTVRFEMELLRVNKRWYPKDAVRKAEADLAKPLAPSPASAPAPRAS